MKGAVCRQTTAFSQIQDIKHALQEGMKFGKYKLPLPPYDALPDE